MANTKTTEQTFTGDGSKKIFPFTIEYEPTKTNNLKVYLGDVLQTETTHYSISGTNLTFVTAPVNNKEITLKRDTSVDSMMAAYSAGSSIRSLDLNNNQEQLLFHAQEIENRETNRFFTGAVPPTNPIAGAIWFEPVSGRSYVYYIDADSGQWVESNPAFSVGDLSNVNITSLTNSNIAANADIEGSKLKDDSVTLAKLGSGALPTDITVNSSNLTADSVDSSELVNGSVDLSHMSANSIDSDQYVDGSIDNVHVASNAAIDAAKISYTNSATGGVERTLDSRLDSVININDFIPTSVTDTSANTVNCATYINNAINALPATGGKIIFPSGLYRITSAITINKNAVVLEGACGMVVGMDNYGVRFKRDDGDNNTFISITNARSIEIRNIGFNGGTFNTTNSGGVGVKPANGAIHVIAQPGTQEHIYENLTFDGIAFCMNFDGLSSSIIRNCKFRTIPEMDAANHIIKLHGSSSTDRSDQIRIVDCIIDGSPAPGLSTTAGLGDWAANTTYSVGNKIQNDRERIYECTVAGTSASSGGPTGAGQSITDNNVTWKWLGNKINHTMRGIYMDADLSTVFISRTSVIRCRDNYYVAGTWVGNFINFENAEAERASYDGFNISGTGNFITIADCFAGTNYEQGINLGTAQNSTVQISNVNCRDNRQNGILINSPTQNISISNPTIGGNGASQSNYYHGISIASASNHVYISGGKCGGGTEDLSGTGPQKYGIQVNGNNHDHIVILGVDVSGNQTGGIEWLTDNNSGNVTASNDNFIKYCPGYSTGQTTFP